MLNMTQQMIGHDTVKLWIIETHNFDQISSDQWHPISAAPTGQHTNAKL